MNKKNKFKIILSAFAFSNLFLVSSTFAFGYPRDNFQRMEEFVHQRDEIRNLRQEPYRQPFNLSEERGLFQLEKDFYGDNPYIHGYEDFDPYRYGRGRGGCKHGCGGGRPVPEKTYNQGNDWYNYWPY